MHEVWILLIVCLIFEFPYGINVSLLIELTEPEPTRPLLQYRMLRVSYLKNDKFIQLLTKLCTEQYSVLLQRSVSNVSIIVVFSVSGDIMQEGEGWEVMLELKDDEVPIIGADENVMCNGARSHHHNCLSYHFLVYYNCVCIYIQQD